MPNTGPLMKKPLNIAAVSDLGQQGGFIKQGTDNWGFRSFLDAACLLMGQQQK
jgi:hypothetical protein